MGAELFHEDGQTGERTSMVKLFIILQISLKTKKGRTIYELQYKKFYFFSK